MNRIDFRNVAARLIWLVFLMFAASCTPPLDDLSKYPAPPPDQELATLMARGISTARPAYPPPIPGPLRGPNPTSTPNPSPTGAIPQAVQAALYYLAGRQEISAAEIEVVSWLDAVWTSERLGCAASASLNRPTAVPGYRVFLRANAMVYELHSSEGGEIICVAETLSPGERVALAQGNNAQATADLARAHLSSRLGIPGDEIRIQGLQPAEWSDAALECSTAGNTPTPSNRHAITGYRILLTAAENLHEYHSGGFWLVYCGAAAIQ